MHGVDTVFGIPGNHNIELYRGLEKTRLRHVTARHEQGVAFMADGYARATGLPGVCFLIGGPGLTNAATGLAQALADSVPLIVIATVGEQLEREGRLHELPDQLALAQSVCLEAVQPASPRAALSWLDVAFARQTDARPGPRCMQIPISWLEREVASLPEVPGPAKPEFLVDLTGALALLAGAQRPVIVVGGGAREAVIEVTELARILSAPVLNTVNGKGIVSPGHPMSVGGSLSLEPVRDVSHAADLVLVVGSELGETDLDLLMLGGPEFSGKPMIRIDIDAQQLELNVIPTVGLVGDAALILRQLLACGVDSHRPWLDVERTRRSLRTHRHYHPEFARLFDMIDRNCPDSIIVGDSTRPTYYASWMWERSHPRTYFHSVSGFGTLGYALPAAIGAQLARPGRQVIAIVGDGGLLFSVGELAVAVAEHVPVKLVVWNNRGYQEIANSMGAAGIDSRATQFSPPDLARLAESFRARVDTPKDWKELEAALQHPNAEPQVIVLDEPDFINAPSGDWYA
jgi:acetolactate synthase-1/2/3 large subunit